MLCATVAIPTFAKFNSAGLWGIDYFTIAEGLGRPLELAYRSSPAPFAYPPTTKLILWPLSYVQSMPGYLAFTVATAFAFLVACRRHLTVGQTALAILAFPFINVALCGQLTFLVSALILSGLGASDRRVAGVLFAIAAAIKPQAAALVPLYLIAIRDWRAFAWAAGAYAVIGMASLIIFGLPAWSAWLLSLSNYNKAFMTTEVIRWVVSPTGIAIRADYPVLPVAAFCMAAALALPFLKYSDPVEALFGLTLGTMLFLPFGIPYEMLGMTPYLARRLTEGRPLEMIPFSVYFPQVSVFAALLAALFAFKAKPGAIARSHGSSIE